MTWQETIGKFLTPATWIAAIAAFVGFTGLVFNATLSLFVGTKIGNYSSVSEHLGAGAGMIVPTIVYAADVLVSFAFLAVVILIVVILVLSLARGLAYLDFLFRQGRLERLKLRAEATKAPKDVTAYERAADSFTKMKKELPFLGEKHLDLRALGKQGAGLLGKGFTFLFVGMFLVWVVVFTLYVPVVEANRVKRDISRAAAWALTGPENKAPFEEVSSAEVKIPFPILSEVARGGPALIGEGADALRGLANWAADETGAGGYLLQARLVGVRMKGIGVTRPMILIADYGDNLVLYDFIFDRDIKDEDISPIRAIKQASIDVVTAIDPEDWKKLNSMPVLAVIAAACGADTTVKLTSAEEADLSSEAKAMTEDVEKVEEGVGDCSEEDLNERNICVRSQLAKGEAVICGTPDPPAADPEKGLMATITALTVALKEQEADLAEQAAVIANIQSDLRATKQSLDALSPAVAEVTGKVTEIGELLREVARNGLRIVSEGGDEPSKPIFVENASTYFIYSDSDGSPAGRWDECEQLASWNADRNGIEFENGRSLLDGPLKNALRFTGEPPAGITPWDVLGKIVAGWIDDAVKSHAADPGERPILFLVGRATENGSVNHNLRLTEQRANAVRRMIIAAIDTELLRQAGLYPEERYTKDDYAIIAIGEGESVLAPAALITRTDNRRVDAYLCHAPGESLATSQP